MADRKQNFAAIFFRNEYRELAGKGYAIIARLSLLNLLTFLALGFAIGGCHQLEERMSNPFTNWVDLSASDRVRKNEKRLVDLAEDPDTAAAYHLQEITKWNTYLTAFHSKDHDPLSQGPFESSIGMLGRTLDAEGELFREILREDSPNFIRRNESLFSPEGELYDQCGIVVSEGMLTRLGFKRSDFATLSAISAVSNEGENIGTQFFFDLIAIVKFLPNKADYVTTAVPYTILQGRENQLLRRRQRLDSTFVQLISDQEGQEDFLLAEMGKHFPVGESGFLVDAGSVVMAENGRTFSSYHITIPRTAELNPGRIAVAAFAEAVTDGPHFAEYAFLECDESIDIETPHNITFNFSELSAIRAFQGKLKDEMGIRLNMNDVESRENFSLVARLTSILGTILFIFGLLSILLYLGNLLQGHVLKIKPHLGTLKAMGLPNQTLLSAYARIVLKLMLVATAIALPLAFGLGWLLDVSWLKVGFELIHFAIPLAIGCILVAATLWVVRVLGRVLSATPGDLIYERE